jgi:hypothetical protein
MRRALLLVSVVFLTSQAGGGRVKTIDLKDLKFGKAEGSVDKPIVITNANELAKVIFDQNSLDKIKAQVDFSKEKLLYFHWSGSGGDKLDITAVKEAGGNITQVYLIYQAGLTRDLRPHHHLFVVPSKTEWKLDRTK